MSRISATVETYTLTHTHTHTYARTHRHTHSLSLSHTHTHTHTHTHIHTHTHTHVITESRSVNGRSVWGGTRIRQEARQGDKYRDPDTSPTCISVTDATDYVVPVQRHCTAQRYFINVFHAVLLTHGEGLLLFCCGTQWGLAFSVCVYGLVFCCSFMS